MKRLIFILGASGSGKTTNVKKLEAKYPNIYHFGYFDQPGVPSKEEVLERYGSWEQWGIERAEEWVKKIRDNFLENRITIFDVHSHPDNIENSCKKFGISDYKVILLDCSDEERKQRLIQRSQPHLINESLLAWAKILRDEAVKRNYIILDNTKLTPEEGFRRLEKLIEELSKN